MGVSLKVWASPPGEQLLRDLAARRVPVKIMIMDADNPALESMINPDLPAGGALEGVKVQTKKWQNIFGA